MNDPAQTPQPDQPGTSPLPAPAARRRTQVQDDLAALLDSQAKALEPVLADASADAATRDAALARMQALRQEAATWRVRQVAAGLAGADDDLASLQTATAEARGALLQIQRWQDRLDAVALVLAWAAAWRSGQVAQGLAATAALKALASPGPGVEPGR